MIDRLTEADIQLHLQQVSGWTLEDGVITRTVKLKDFGAAMLFVNAVGWLAEAAGHHPDIVVKYNTVKLSLSTHDADGITAKDFALAQQIDVLPTIG